MSSLNAAATPLWQVQARAGELGGPGAGESLEEVGEDMEHPWKPLGKDMKIIKHMGNHEKKGWRSLGSGEDRARMGMLSVCWISLF